MADAGLYHYTTRVDQTKDGVQTGNVVIGRHYIATTGPTSTQPIDTDNDGIPDYVENWHGDGDGDGTVRLHADTETDWRHNYSDATNPDSLNALYDNVDLDGNGMVGAIEKALHPASPQPLVADNPLTLSAPASGSQANTLTFLVPVPFSTVTDIGQLHLTTDGQLARLLRCDLDAGSGNCLLTWDTTYTSPGRHVVQIELCLYGQAPPGILGPPQVITAAPTDTPYVYPLTPDDPDWYTCDPFDRVNSVVIPDSWLAGKTSWQVFISAFANPYLSAMWVPGTSLSDSYEAAKSVSTLSILQQVENDSQFAANVLRFLGSVNPVAVAAGSWDIRPCPIHYMVACNMAASDVALNAMSQQSLQTLFARAVWDTYMLLSTYDTMEATAPLLLMYKIYPRLSPQPIQLLSYPLTTDQWRRLDIGELPLDPNYDVGQVVSAAVSDLHLTSRP